MRALKSAALALPLALISCAALAEDTPIKNTSRDMTAPLDLSTPEATAYSMMRAMYQGDADMVDRVFLEGAELRRATPEGVRPDARERWQDWVSGLEIGEADEEIFDLRVEQFGQLATVWAPFVISVKGELVGCGVNQLTMAEVDGEWRIVFAMDTQDPGDCATFKARYRGDG